MKRSLVIVESPAKARTINKYLGKGFKVMASVGHIKDLPKSKLGVDLDNDFEPEYVTIKGKAKTISELKKAAKSVDSIYLAPDPDREGEAIAWHIASEVSGGKDGPKVYRVLFNEITERAIKEAIENPVALDQNKFEAQQARRVLDRLVGYQVSPILWEKVRRGLSAGRVQSVAVRLICEREREVQAFKPREYWSITAFFDGAKDAPGFKAKLAKRDGKKFEIKTGEEAAGVLKDLSGAGFSVEEVSKKERKKNPLPPFITSTLQQEAARKLSYTAKKTMAVAQQLYEGVEVGAEGSTGLITYMRTDSVRLATEAVAAAREFIKAAYGADYLPAKPSVYKSKKSAQQAHEAVRPTYLKHPPDKIKQHLTSDQFKLYRLIWNRFLACQMMPALLDLTRVDIKAAKYMFQANGSVLKFPGFTAVYEEGKDVEEEKEQMLPVLEKGTTLACEELKEQQHFTQPPPRYTEATLIKTLEENGIGRPSTYAAIISTVQERQYVVKEKRQLKPTELGFVVTDLLVKSFPNILDVKFTAHLEEELDRVEVGKVGWVGLMRNFYGPFKESLDRARTEMKSVKTEEVPTDVTCEKCGKMMVIKWGRRGKFLACSGYPDCKSTTDFKTEEDGKVVPIERVLEVRGECPKCSSPMVVKSGRFGRFLACSAYPKCKSTQPLTTGVPCPTDGCDGELVEKRTKRGGLFFSCSRYPKCDYATWKDPTAADAKASKGTD